MTDAAARQAHQHLTPARHRTVGSGFAQRLAIGDKGLPAKLAHGVLSPPTPCFSIGLERDEISSNRHPALAFCLSMIFSENRLPLFGIMLCDGRADRGEFALATRTARPRPLRRAPSDRARPPRSALMCLR